MQRRAVLCMCRTTAAAPEHGPVLGPARARAAQTCYMNENWSSSLRLDLSLKNSGKSLVVVWKNLPAGDPLDTQNYPQVNMKPPSEAGLLLGISLRLRPREIHRSSPASLGGFSFTLV